MNKYKYILLGNSAAAVACAEAIRSVDKVGTLAMVSAENTLAYSPALTTYYISGTIQEKNIYYRQKDFYKKNKIDTYFGKPATVIDKNKKVVRLADGSILGYEKTLIATGGTPQKPELTGVELDGVFTLRTIDDAKRIKTKAKSAKNAVVLGGGLVGLRAAYALHQLGLKVTIIVSSGIILSQNLDAESALIIQDWLKEKNFNILTGTDVKAIEGKSLVQKVRLNNEKTVEADIVIIGKGVSPNASVAKDAGLEVDRGIVVNNKMQTSDNNIFAAGDVAQAWDKLLRKKVVNAIWPAAIEQGRVAGNNMAGGEEKYEGSFAMNSVDFYGLSVLSIGITKPKKEREYEIVVTSEPAKNYYRKLVFKNDILVGAILLGDIDRAGILTGIINDGVKVTSFKESLINDKFGFMVLPKEIREEKMTRTGSS